MTIALWKEISILIMALELATVAGWLDWRTRRIPNWLTVPALLAGILANTLAWGWPGTKAALEGAAWGLGLLLPFVLLRGLGAGDWKLMGALGAFLGPQRFIVVFIATALIAGVMAAIEMVRQKRVVETIRNVFVLVHALITFRVRPSGQGITLDNPGLLKVPFGVAAAVATVLFFCTVAGLQIFLRR